MRAKLRRVAALVMMPAIGAAMSTARADVVTEWNAKAATIATAAQMPPPPTYRAMAILQVAVFDAVNAINPRYPIFRVKIDAPAGASLNAAVAAVNRTALTQLVPTQQASIDAAYQAALTGIPDGPGKTDGIAVGERAAAAVLAYCADDGSTGSDVYRPLTTPGVYVPTSSVITPWWGKRRPWFMSRFDEFRPGPPPSLTSETWARDYNEIKSVGARTRAQRSREQTDIARFWQATTPAIYFPVARSVALGRPGRDATTNARVLAAVAMVMDDALIAVFDAKYEYNFWRPITAIRNGDIDGNDATERDAAWLPLIDTPLHPEYPCADCSIVGAVAAVVDAAVATPPPPRLTSTSPTAPDGQRSWDSTDALVTEVTLARIYGGVHVRNSTEVGRAMGKLIGEQVVRNFLLVAR